MKCYSIVDYSVCFILYFITRNVVVAVIQIAGVTLEFANFSKSLIFQRHPFQQPHFHTSGPALWDWYVGCLW